METKLTSEQINEVNDAVYEIYTLDETYKLMTQGKWTVEMFKLFMKKVITNVRRK
jgi:hypothetical protein